MAMKEFNVDLDIKGKVSATDVPNSTGSIVTWNTTTNVFGLRTNAQIISDLNLSSSYITTNTTQTGLTGNKTTSGVITSTGGFVGALTGNASTATTLATSRTINGTSFDGTANIVTSYWGTARWGTARNITIGDTTKSVNGSANVAWSLAEIGAASSTSLNDYVPLTSLANGNRITTYPHQNYFGTTTDGKYIIIDLGQVTATMTTIEILVRQYGQTRSTTNIVISWQDNNANTSSIDNIICDNPDFYPSVSMGKSPTTGNGCIIIETSQTSLSYCSVLVKRIVNVNGLSGNITSYAVADLTGFTNVVTRTYTRDSYLLNYNNLTNKPTIPTVNNGQLTLSTGTGLSGSATFTANQSGSSTFSVAVASTHKLPTTAEWNALPTTNTITRLRGTTSGAFTSGDLTLLAGANTTITQSGANITIASTNTNTTYSAGTGLSLTGTTFANTAPNATHTGDVTGSTALTIANSAVTHAKYQNIATQRILGRGEAGTGNVQELTLGANLSLSTSGVLSSSNTTYVAGTGLSLSGNTFSVKYGTAAGTAAQGNDSRINNGQTAFGWGDFRDYGLGTNAISSGNLDIITETGFYIANTSTIGSPMAVAGIAVNHIQISSTNATQTAYRTGDTRSWFRRKSSGVWSDWVELIHTGNLNTNVSGLGFIKSADLTGYVPTSRTITAGDGLSGGGSLAANRTITLATPSAITLTSTNSVAESSHTHAFTPGGTTAQYIRGDGTLATMPTFTDAITTISRNGVNIPIVSKNVDIPVFSTSGAGLVPARVGSTTTKYLREDGNWVAPATYSLITAAELNTGTATSARTISAERLTTWLGNKALLLSGGTVTGNLSLIGTGYFTGDMLFGNNGQTTEMRTTIGYDGDIRANNHLKFLSDGSVLRDKEHRGFMSLGSNGLNIGHLGYEHLRLHNQFGDIRINDDMMEINHEIVQVNSQSSFNVDVVNGKIRFAQGSNTQVSPGVVELATNNLYTTSGVHLGSISNRWGRLYAQIGNFSSAVTATAFYESSLRKFKTNIKPFKTSALKLIDSLDIVTFDRIDDKTKNKIGVIADDTSEEFLSEDKDAVDLYKTIFIQAKAIQELEKKNQSLEDRLSRLEKLVNKLTSD